MSADTDTASPLVAEGHGTDSHGDGHGAGHGSGVHEPWTPEQRQLTAKIAVGFVVGLLMVGIIGPIALSVVIGLLQGYHRF